ncbi:MAG: efflux transporter periplasmic adaptor subunit, partial [Bacteroidales bacterium]|nr:efflux transporter periplasmic adaptor subunit [Bacteroidales bacterium]
MKKITILLAISLFVMAGCKKKDTAVIAGDQKMTIRTQEVHVEDVEQTYEYNAIVEANAVNNIAP